MSQEVNIKMIDVSISLSFEQYAEAFQKSPSADNFTRLESSMYALQYWRGLMPVPRADVAAELWPMSIGGWVRHLQQKALYRKP